MPAFIRTKRDEERWDKAKKAANKTRSESEGNIYWGLVNHIYQNMKKSEDVAEHLRAIVSLSKTVDDQDTLDRVTELLLKAKDEDPEEDLENYGFHEIDPDEQEGDEADQWLKENEPSKAPDKDEFQEYSPDEDEEQHQQEIGGGGTKPITPESPKTKSGFSQPTKQELAELREYTRPWEQRARDTAKLRAEAHKNPILHREGRLIEARNKSHQDRQRAYDEMAASDEYKNADPITQMDMDSKFNEDWNKANPGYHQKAVSEHSKAHEDTKNVHDIHRAAQDEQIRHILEGGSGGVPGETYSTEEGMQHAGGIKGEEGTEGTTIKDPAAAFAAGNQEFLKDYAQRFNQKSKKPANLEDMVRYDKGAQKDINSILGDHPSLKDPEKKVKIDKFFKEYYPLIAVNAHRVLNRLGIDKNSPEADLSLLHEAGMHGLFQAINDYEHDNPSKAGFSTHAGHKIRGLMMTAMRNQDQIPASVRRAARDFQRAKAADIKLKQPEKAQEPTKVEEPAKIAEPASVHAAQQPQAVPQLMPAQKQLSILDIQQPRKSEEAIKVSRHPDIDNIKQRHMQVTSMKNQMKQSGGGEPGNE